MVSSLLGDVMAAMTKPEVEEVPDHVLSAKEKNDLQEEATNK
tara:strand:+ start:249 stop:374 length:126 start_codon:yes stop_codon:yes gene_type:complete